jgi:hypothetical protein
MSPRRVAAILLLLAATLAASAGHAIAGPKVDVVVLENGDRLACEIKGLARGRLSLSTDAFETVRVYWDRVDRITSPRLFEVERTGGERHYGALGDAGPRRVRVEPIGAPALELDHADVIRITPIELRLWSQFDGRVDLGFNFAKANRETRWTLNAEGKLRTRHYAGRATIGSQVSRRDDAERLARNAATVTGNRFIGPRWSALLIGQLQQNEELSLDLRTVAGGGLGRYMVQTNRTLLQVFGGAAYTRERFAGVQAEDRAEAVLSSNLDWFSARNSHVDLTLQALSFYGLERDSRLRLELQGAFRVEFLGDFYVGVNGYESVDSRPPPGRARTDVGVSLTLGWTF